MGQVIIDHPQGYDTVFSHEEDSPAYPYLQRHHAPQSVDDLFELGFIPKGISRDAIHEARAAGLNASSSYLRVTDRAVFSAPPSLQRSLVQARLNTQARNTMEQATASHLMSSLGIGSAQAELLAAKAHSIVSTHEKFSPDAKPYFYSLDLADDLIVKSRLIVAPSITILRARSVRIHRTGEVRAHGKYLLIRCASIYGPGLWEFLSDQVREVNAPKFIS